MNIERESQGHYINGEWSQDSDEYFESINPANNESLGEFPKGTSSDIEKAVEAAGKAQRNWRELSYIDRAEYLWDIYFELRDRKNELGEIVTKESGKEISEGIADVVEASHMVEWAAGNARHPHGEVIPSEVASKDSYMRRKPKGVVGCITPWNFPVAIPFWHMAVTLVEGNTVVWKPAEQTPLCGEIIAEIFDEVDIPIGVFNMVQGMGDAGSAIVDNPDVDTVIFTGSAEVGEQISREVAMDPGKTATCEMGGKNAVVVTGKADLDIAIHSAVMSSFKTTGQRCVSSERIIVDRDIYPEFREEFVDIAEDLAVGDPLNSDTFMGPLADRDQVEKFRRYNELARNEGVDVLVDREELREDEVPSGFSHGFWVGPFVYETEYDEELRCIHEEVFGPHVALIPYEGDVEKAVELHNSTDYGLSGSIISEDYREINYFRDHAEIGLCYANLPSIGAEIQLPFGGVKKSGSGFPYAREIIESVTHRTAFTVNNDRDVEMAQGLSSEIKTRDE